MKETLCIWRLSVSLHKMLSFILSKELDCSRQNFKLARLNKGQFNTSRSLYFDIKCPWHYYERTNYSKILRHFKNWVLSQSSASFLSWFSSLEALSMQEWDESEKMQFGPMAAFLIFHYVLKQTNPKSSRTAKDTSNCYQ